MKSPINSYDKHYRFTDIMGNKDNFHATSLDNAKKQYRDRLAHIDRLGIDRAIKIVENVTVEIVK